MAYEYKGRYYATLASQRAAILRDEYKNNQGALKAFQTIAKAQVPQQYSRQPNLQAQRDLATWEIAKAFEKTQQQAAPAPAPPPPPPPAPAPAPAPSVTPTNVYQPKIEGIGADITQQEADVQQQIDKVIKPAENIDFQKQLEEQRAAYEKQLEALKISNLEAVAKAKEESRAAFDIQLGQSQKQIDAIRAQMQIDAQKAMNERAYQQQQTQTMLQQQQQAYASQTAGLQQQLERQAQSYQQSLSDLAANQRAFQINQARGTQAADLQIASMETPKLGGTTVFKRRPPAATTIFGINPNLNIGQTSVLNV